MLSTVAIMPMMGWSQVKQVVSHLGDYLDWWFTSVPPIERCSSPEELRTYAISIMDKQPGFAQDLLAAVDRHEGGL